MTTFKAFIGRCPVASYFILAFGISWGGLLALGGLSGISAATWQSDPRLPFFGLAMVAGPSVAGLVLTAALAGRAGLRELLSRSLRWRVKARWYAVALLTAPLVFSVLHVALSLASPVFVSSVVTASDRTSLLLAGIVAAFVVGVLEELGWTGFAIPRLRERFGSFATAIIVGVPWGAWHLLTNDIWIARSYSGELPIAVFVSLTAFTLIVGQLPAYRVLMVWVYERTGSLLVAMLMHASLSASTFMLGPPMVTGVALVAYGFALASAWWFVVAIVAAVSGRPVSRQVLRRVTSAAAVVAATVALAGPTTSAQSSCGGEDFVAWAVNRGPSVSFVTTPVDIHIERWSTESEKDQFVRTLLDDGGPDALLSALRQADPVGLIRTPVTLVDDVVFAWQEPHGDGGRRIILITDQPMVVWQESMQILGNENLFTVVELRIAQNGEGEGKVAIGSNIVVDRLLGLVQLENYAAEPVRLIYVREVRR